jgi:hypothetical protein
MLTAKADIPELADEAKADYTTRLKQHQRRAGEIQARNATMALPDSFEEIAFARFDGRKH